MRAEGCDPGVGRALPLGIAACAHARQKRCPRDLDLRIGGLELGGGYADTEVVVLRRLYEAIERWGMEAAPPGLAGPPWLGILRGACKACRHRRLRRMEAWPHGAA